MQVQLQVMCGVCACTRCRFFHVSIATSGKVIFCATVIVYIVRSLYHWFFESYKLRIFFIFFFTFPYWDFGSDSNLYLVCTG